MGQILQQLDLHGALALQVRRADGRVLQPDGQLVLGEGDAVVLSGSQQQLALAEDVLLGGG